LLKIRSSAGCAHVHRRIEHDKGYSIVLEVTAAHRVPVHESIMLIQFPLDISDHRDLVASLNPVYLGPPRPTGIIPTGDTGNGLAAWVIGVIDIAALYLDDLSHYLVESVASHPAP